MAVQDTTTRRQLVGQLHRVGIPPENVTLVAIDKPAIAGHRTWTSLTKLADEIKNSDTALADDTELTVAVQADDILLARLCIFYDTASVPDFKFKLNSTQTADAFDCFGYYSAPGSAVTTGFDLDSLATETSILAASGTQGSIYANIRLQNGATAALFSFQWAQDTSDAGDTTVLAGSFLEHFVIGG